MMQDRMNRLPVRATWKPSSNAASDDNRVLASQKLSLGYAKTSF